MRQVVHCKRSAYDVYIGRPTVWGNPFTIGKDGTRAEVIEKYQAWLQARPALIDKAKAELKGKVLACWCSPLPCHGDILAQVSNHE